VLGRSPVKDKQLIRRGLWQNQYVLVNISFTLIQVKMMRKLQLYCVAILMYEKTLRAVTYLGSAVTSSDGQAGTQYFSWYNTKGGLQLEFPAPRIIFYN
jgi:hypothetical protein